MMKNSDLKVIKDTIEKYDNILIAGHKNPDGDCIGSTLALANSLEKLGKNVTAYIKELPSEYKVLKGIHVYSSNIQDKYDLVITLDCADNQRFEIKKQFENAKETISIDHHVNNPMFATYNYVDVEASATAEIIYMLLTSYNYPIDKVIAEHLYTGIISDTGLFQNRNTVAATHDIVARLMEYDIDFNKIITSLFFRKTFTELKLFSKAFENATLYHDNKIIISSLSLDEINKTKAKPNETSNIISMLRQVDGVKIAIFIYEPIPKNVKVSFRCDIPYNVFEIASSLGGGGHILASGVIIKNKTIDEVKKMVLELADEQINRFEN